MEFINEIIELPLGEYESYNYSRRWIFALDGRLVQQQPNPEMEMSDIERFRYDARFTVGDIVAIKPKLREWYSPSVKGDWGGVAETPSDKQEWIDSGNDPEDWDGYYLIYYITNDSGIINHKHIPEQALAPVSGDVPKELCFLNTVAAHFNKGETIIPDDMYNKIFNETLVVKNVEVLDQGTGDQG